MAEYGSLSAVQELVQATDDDVFTGDQATRITNLLPVVSALIEDETGAVFGVNASETVLIDADGGSILFLPKGIRSVTSIVESPDWSGSAWVNGTTLLTTSYRLNGLVNTGAYRQLIRTDGGWTGPYAITGVWEDQVPSPVPAEITYIANYIVAETYKKQNASPAGFQGPDGAVVPIRNVFKEPEVRKVLNKWTVGPVSWVV